MRFDAPVEVTIIVIELGPFHSSFAEFHEGYVSRYIEIADTKAAWTFVIASGLLAYAFSSDALRLIFQHPAWSCSFLLLAATTLLLILSAYFSFLVIAPRLATSGEGIVYFGAVAKRKSANIYVRDIASKTEAHLTELRLKHCYDLSKICHSKYEGLKWAIWLGVPALVGVLILILFA